MTAVEPSAPSRLDRTTTVLLTALLAAHALLGWQLRARAIFTFGDDAAYVLLSRSLRAFSYREVQYIGEPIAARFPPAYPALLAISSTLFGERLQVVAILGILFSVSGIWALFDVVRRRWSTNIALVVAALVAINPALLEFTAMPLTEMMFTSLVLWTLWVADRMDASARSGASRSRAWRGAAAMAITLAIMAAMTRSIGATLLVALFAHWVWRRQWRTVIALVAAGTVVVGGWLAWTSLAPKREVRLSYIDDAVRPSEGEPSLPSIIAGRVARNVPVYVTQVSLTLIPVPVTPRTIFDNVAWIVVLGSLFVVGWVAAWRRWHAAAVFFVAYCGLLAVWPYLLDRFLVPVVPLGIAFIIIGTAAVGARVRRWGDAPVLAVGAPLALFALRADAAMTSKASNCDRSRVDCTWAIALDYIDAARWAKQFTPPAARFLAPKGPTLYYHGARKSVFWEEAVRQDSTSFLPYLRRNGVEYILSTPVYGDYQTILALVERSCTRFAVVHTLSPHTAILAFRDSAATETEGARACAYVRRALATAASVVTASPDSAGDIDRSLGVNLQAPRDTVNFASPT